MHTWEAIRFVRHALEKGNITDSPAMEAKVLVGKITGLSDTELVTKREKVLSSAETIALRHVLDLRLSHVPVAYILGHQEFYGLDFLVDRRVLIPRSDTETIIDTVKRETTSSPSLRLLDVCTGSGCIGITLSRLLGCPVTLADISNDALDVAGENARRLLSTPFTIIQSDLFSNIHDMFDIIVSNPPYLTQSWINEADEQVRKEPMLALDGQGEDGLSVIKRLIVQAADRLAYKGKLFIECDDRQTQEVKQLLLANGFGSVYSEKDLAGQERVVWGELSCTNR